VRLLWRASLRHLGRHPAQLALALAGMSLGVGTIVAVDIAAASSRRAFELSVQAVNGPATHVLSAAPGALDESLYVRLVTRALVPGLPQPRYAPRLSAYARIGTRLLQLEGLDPFASAALAQAPGAGAGGGAALVAGVEAARAWFMEPGAVLLGARTAAELHLARGAHFALQVGGATRRAVLIGTLPDSGGYEALLLTDIAQAQEWLNAHGQLSGIDLRLPPGEEGRALEAALRRQLPPGATLSATRARSQETFAMTDAFTTNLRALSLLALLVGTFLIYSALSFAVLQRRAIIGVLRALGASRAAVLGVVLAEAAVLGLIGATLGTLLGLAIGRTLVGLVARTINDLYFVVSVTTLTLPAATLAKALLAGVGTALVAALLPALEVAASVPQLALARTVLEARARRLARALVGLATLLAGLSLGCVWVFARSLLAGFVALFLLLLAVAAVTPGLLEALARGAARLTRRRSPLARLALEDVAASLSRTGVAVAALSMALTAMIGVAVMVASFRGSLAAWLLTTLRADVYVSAPALESGAGLTPALVQQLESLPGVRAHSEARRTQVESEHGALEVNAVRLGPYGAAAYQLVAGESAAAWAGFAHGALLISEPLAWRLRLAPGAALRLMSAAGPRALPIVGVYREYGNERGEVLMALPTYRQLWGDTSLSGLGLYLAPGTSEEALMAQVRARAAAAGTPLLVRSNAAIRALSLGIFERTFIITRVLYWLAAGVAALGLVSALLAWQLARERELALLRSLGLTPRGSAALIVLQTLFMGAVALLAAVPAGLATALMLTEVINRRAFGWHIDLYLALPQFSNALLLALLAALGAALYPAWRSARAPLAAGLRAE
jgi:putative ABC transport system permease protein